MCSINRNGTTSPVKSRSQLTPRDFDSLLYVDLHGVVTAEQIARRFFPSTRTCYYRLQKLVALRLLRRDLWRWRHPAVYRVTRVGAQLVSDTVGPANLIVSEIPHSLAVVDLTEQLLQSHPEATLTTERELRGQRLRAIHDRSRDAGRGRIPDGLLTFPDGKLVAIELDLTPKRERLYAQHVRAFGSERFSVLWYVPSEETATRLRRVVSREYAEDRVRVFVWRP
jgi:hypothetical protein